MVPQERHDPIPRFKICGYAFFEHSAKFLPERSVLLSIILSQFLKLAQNASTHSFSQLAHDTVTLHGLPTDVEGNIL